MLLILLVKSNTIETFELLFYVGMHGSLKSSLRTDISKNVNHEYEFTNLADIFIINESG